MRYHLVALFLVLGAVISQAPALGNDRSDADRCRPTYREISAKPVGIDAGAWTFRSRVLLIGCAKELQLLGAKELTGIIEVLTSMFREKGLDIQFHPLAYREEMIVRIKAALGKAVVTDIFFFSISNAERM